MRKPGSEGDAMGDDNKVLPAADASYATLLADLRAIITDGRSRAAVAVNAEIVSTYWQIGERIVREEQAGHVRAGYGAQVLAKLGRQLSQEFGRGFAERSLQNMRQFYLTYPIPSAVRTELTWTHYRTLMRLPDDQQEFYAHVARTGRWSSRELEREHDPIGLILCGTKNEQVIELLLADPNDRVDERIKVAQYLLLDQEEALKARLAQLRTMHDQARGTVDDDAP